MQSETNVTAPGRGRMVLKWGVRIVGGIVALVLLAAIVAAAREYFALREDRKRFPQQGQRLDVGGYSLNLYCTG